MENFIYNIPTRAYFGKGQVSNLGAAIKEFGGSKVLLAYGGGSIKTNGIYDDVVAQFESHGIGFVELAGIKPNPRVESVNEGVALYRENGCDFILAVGGGSTLDAAKAIAAGVSYEGDVLDLLTGKAETKNPAPLGTILTMAGTGSEMDLGGVITAGEDNKKLVIMHPELFPKFSILDPEYTLTVPAHHSMAGCADILCHLMEQYLTPECGADVQDRMNEGLMKVVLDNSANILANPQRTSCGQAQWLWQDSNY
ncbi:iron-containing alcohol dehydrogenase [Vibrio hannami]|uniref:iron-containing alcohol dehydrogenase n=1 Tax=Vibrio hannami TaxID=2717094 RepID=UPI003BB207BB